MQIRLLVLLAVIALCSACFAQAADSLRLSVAYPDPTFAKITCVFQNRLDKPVKITSPDTPMGFLQSIQVITANGIPVKPFGLMSANPAPFSLVVPAHSMRRVKTYMPDELSCGLSCGTLYFLSMDFATDLPGKHFTGTFPYGLLEKDETLVNSKPGEPSCFLSMESTGPFSFQMALVLTNNTATAVPVLSTMWLNPAVAELVDATGKSYPVLSISYTGGSGIDSIAIIKPGETTRMPFAMYYTNVKLESGKLYFVIVHCPILKELPKPVAVGSEIKVNDGASSDDFSGQYFTGIFPIGLPIIQPDGSLHKQ